MGAIKWTFIILSIIVAYMASKFMSNSQLKSKVIQIGELGSVQGIVSTSREGREYSEYLGIPFAKPPIGSLRFEAPENPEPWNGLKSANVFGSECVQRSMISGKIGGDEDCLFLNVFVPKVTDDKTLLPVMFFIHGGAFYEGSSNFYRPGYFMDHDIILVTINYRLAALGFLNSNDGLIRGNMGLKDQNMALKWVNKYIQYFGGDKNKITIFGESAGGASVHYHMMSPLSKGLFQRAISQSGTAFQPRAFFGGNTEEQIKRLAKQLSCPISPAAEMVDCLKSIPAYKFVEVQTPDIKDALRDAISLYSPTKELINDSKTFLSDHPTKMVASLKSTVPWITGVNSHEGLLVEAMLARNESLRKILAEDWSKKMPYFLHLPPKSIDVTHEIKKFYFEASDGSSKHLEFDAAFENYTNLLSDRFFLFGFHEAAKMHVEKSSPVYLYYFQYQGAFSLYTFLKAIKGNYHPVIEVLAHLAKTWVNRVIFGIEPPQYGVCHADELQYLFSLEKMNHITKDNPDYSLSKEMVRLWVSFAKNEESLHFNQVEWKPLYKSTKAKNLHYLKIDNTPSVIDEPFANRMLFWNRFRDLYWSYA